MTATPSLALSLFALGAAPIASPLLTGYFGEDRRVPAYSDPSYNAVQRLELADGWCTAFMVAPQFALTAGHCAKDHPVSLSLDQTGIFSAGFSVDTAYVAPDYAVTPGSDGVTYTRDDWALVHLQGTVTLPTLELATAEDLVVGATAMTIGYPGPEFLGKTRVVDPACVVKELRDDSILTDCATSKGQSGGPLLIQTKAGKWKVAGICSTELLRADGTTVEGAPYTPESANRFTNITSFAGAIRAATNR